MADTIITDRGMRALPGASDIYIIESGKRGHGRFVGRITPAGARLFYFRYTPPGGTRVMLLIGSYDPKGDGIKTFTVLQARARAQARAALYLLGQHDLRGHLEQRQEDARQAEADARQAAADAREAARAAKQAAKEAAEKRITVRRLFVQWQLAELTPHARADGSRTGRKDAGQWVLDSFERRLFPTLGEMAAAEVRKSHLLEILDTCKAEGHRRSANVLLADLKQMFRFASDREIVLRNPLEGIKRASVGGKDVERDRVLNDGEVRHLAKLVPLANLGPRTVAAVWAILSTGCRVGELMNAEWRHVDLVAATWYLSDTKNQRDHLIRLSSFALRQFEALASLKEAGTTGATLPWVFPNSAGIGPVCVKTFGKQLADRQRLPEHRLSNRTKNTGALALVGGGWTAHDLRRTAATLMASMGVSTDVIDECLNHKLQSKVARVYIRDRRLPEQARAFDALGAKLEELTSGNAIPSNVRQIRVA